MASPTQTVSNSRYLLKVLTKQVKVVLNERGINPSTRKGNKELQILVKQLAKESFTSLEQVKKVGEALAEAIVEISQKRKKENLDRGVIFQLILEGKVPDVASFVTVQSQQISPLLPKSSATIPKINSEESKTSKLMIPVEEE